MPRIYHRMEETGYHILNPITEQVVNGILDKIDCLRNMGDSIYILHSLSAYSSTNDRNGGINLTKDRCDVEARFILDPPSVPWPNLSPYATPAYGMRTDYNGNHRTIFDDDYANVHLEEYTVPAAIEMDFTLTFQTFDAAMKCFDMLKLLNVGTVSDMSFDLAYDYPLTVSMNEMLYAVFQARQDYTGKDYIQYLRDFQKNKITFDIRKVQLTDPRADVELMVRCQQLLCQGLVTFDQPEPVVVREGNTPDKYTLSFNYKIQFGRPVLIVGIVPVTVDNHFLPFSLFERDESTGSKYVGGQFQDPWMDPGIMMNYKNYVLTNQLVRFPEFDDWLIKDKLIEHFQFKPFIIGCFTLDEGVTEIDLLNMDGVMIDPTAQTLMQALGQEIFFFGGFFNITIMADTMRLNESLLEITDDLKVRVNVSEKRAHYYIVVSETTNIRFLNQKWFSLLLKYRYYFPMFIMRNLQFLLDNHYLTPETTDLVKLIKTTQEHGVLPDMLSTMIKNKDTSGVILQYSHDANALADYMTATRAANPDPYIPQGDDPYSKSVVNYMTQNSDIKNRTLFNAFIEISLFTGLITDDQIPEDDIRTPNGLPYCRNIGPVTDVITPLRVLKYHYRRK